MDGDFTTRMLGLLAAMRRERNGAVAGAMRCYGAPCGLNYGVSLPTVRGIARASAPDHAFARYLWRQDVRELRLAALHLAEPERLVPAEFAEWAAGIVNSELAEEAAFALLGRAGAFPSLFEAWVADAPPLLRYAALMAAPRSAALSEAWIVPAAEAVRRAAREAEQAADDAPSGKSGISPSQAAQLAARGAVALFAALGARNEENRQAVLRAAGSLGKLPAEDYVHEELAWRL